MTPASAPRVSTQLVGQRRRRLVSTRISTSTTCHPPEKSVSTRPSAATTSPTTRLVCSGTTRKLIYCRHPFHSLTHVSFYMKYAPDEEGNFAGQIGYGYISFEKFIDAVNLLNDGKVTLDQLDARPLPTLKNTIATTAILEAGRRSLDENRPIEIIEENGVWSLK